MKRTRSFNLAAGSAIMALSSSGAAARVKANVRVKGHRPSWEQSHQGLHGAARPGASNRTGRPATRRFRRRAQKAGRAPPAEAAGPTCGRTLRRPSWLSVGSESSGPYRVAVVNRATPRPVHQPRRSVLPLKHALILRWCEDQSDLRLVRRGSG